MSKKFEIVNGKWIRQKKYGSGFNSIKINSINSFETDADGKYYHITLGSVNAGEFISFIYEKTDKEEYEADLKFFEDLLFNQ